MPLFCSFAVPLFCLCVVLGNAFSFVVTKAEAELGFGISKFSLLLLYRQGFILLRGTFSLDC